MVCTRPRALGEWFGEDRLTPLDDAGGVIAGLLSFCRSLETRSIHSNRSARFPHLDKRLRIRSTS